MSPERREAWVAKRVEVGVDVLVCHPRLVQMGRDVVEFPTIVWAETELSVLQSASNAAVFVGSEFAPWSIVANELARSQTTPDRVNSNPRVSPPRVPSQTWPIDIT